MCCPGYMFAALPGSMVDGAKYIGDAVKNGARLILTGSDVDLHDSDLPEGVGAVLRDANPRRQLCPLGANDFSNLHLRRFLL